MAWWNKKVREGRFLQEMEDLRNWVINQCNEVRDEMECLDARTKQYDWELVPPTWYPSDDFHQKRANLRKRGYEFGFKAKNGSELWIKRKGC
jgi:hypothetical protein